MIVYLHGFMGCKEDWDFYCSRLDGPHLPLTLPGHDGTPLPKDPVAALLPYIEKPITLIGYSLGGRLAMDFANRYPHLIKKLIVLSANPGIEEKSVRQQRIEWDESWCQLIDREGMRGFLEKWYAQSLFDKLRQHSDFPLIFQKRLEHHPEAIKAVLRSLSPAVLPPLWTAAKKFSFSSLFLFGEYDVKYHTIEKNLANLGLQTKQLSNCGHALHIENPEACLKAIEEFI